MELNNQSLILIAAGQYTPTSAEVRKIAAELLATRTPLLIMTAYSPKFSTQVYGKL